eukprot:Skav219832  [mRNA]  locus=scaffold859:14823:16928:+ [translate_table: standard]
MQMVTMAWNQARQGLEDEQMSQKTPAGCRWLVDQMANHRSEKTADRDVRRLGSWMSSLTAGRIPGKGAGRCLQLWRPKMVPPVTEGPPVTWKEPWRFVEVDEKRLKCWEGGVKMLGAKGVNMRVWKYGESVKILQAH